MADLRTAWDVTDPFSNEPQKVQLQPVIPVLRRLKHVDERFDYSLGYKMGPFLKKQTSSSTTVELQFRSWSLSLPNLGPFYHPTPKIKHTVKEIR